MTVILIRTLVIYGLLIMIMRFMGKRQLGELEIADLVTTLLISEVASLPLTDPDVPLTHALLPVLTLMALEVLLSGALLKCPPLKKMLSVRPAILVRHGVPDRAAMARTRISSEELMSQLRQKEVSDLTELEYAILEPNGQISVTRKAREQPVTRRDMGIKAAEAGMMHLVISDGRVNLRNLELAGKDPPWLERFLRTHGARAEEIFMLLVDDGGEVKLFPKTAEAPSADPPKPTSKNPPAEGDKT